MNKGEYAHPELLAETDWLAERLDDPGIRIVDCDPVDAYLRAHIPGAVSIGPNHYIKDPEHSVHVMPPRQIAEFFGSLGLGDDTLVVAYEGRNSPWAARLWWVLNYYGHTRVKVLNGGWRTWLAEGRPVTDEPAMPPRAVFTPRPNPSLIIKGHDLKAAIGKKGTVIWDVRSRQEYTGENTRGNKRGGHIPGAVHLEWNSLVEPDGTGRFKSAEEVRRTLAEKGITPEQQVYTQ
ncbi:MAG: sulfurtransferase [Chloroflexi bacterium]|nr:sulfurtransferase [Chloroflexota bacterium]